MDTSRDFKRFRTVTNHWGWGLRGIGTWIHYGWGLFARWGSPGREHLKLGPIVLSWAT